MKTDLNKITETFKKYLKMDNTKLMMLHSALATMLSQKMEGTPVWLLFVGPSGDGKSEILMSLNNSVNTFIIHELTSNSLVSGFEKKRKKEDGKWEIVNCDLAPQINGKVVLIPDMAQILKLHPNEKAKVWAQLRELYDGRASKKTGNMEKIKEYKNLRVTLMGCSTPAIDSQILIHQDLGTRELIFRTDLESDFDLNDISQKVWDNEGNEDIMRTDLNISVNEFLKGININQNIEISKEVQKELVGYVDVLRHLRASAEVDSYSGELIGVVYPEQPTRVLKQLKRIFICLKSLDEKYPDELALQVIKHIVKSSISYNRWIVLNAISEFKNQVGVSTLGQKIKLGTKTIYRELNILWNLGLIERIIEYKEYYGKKQEVQYWKFKDSDLNNCIKKVFSSPDTPSNKSIYIFSINTFFQIKEEKKNNNDNSSSCQQVYSDTPNIKEPKELNPEQVEQQEFSDQELKKALEELE